MGFGDFISGKLEKSFIEGERDKEVEEFHKNKKHETREMAELLENKEGISPEDAQVLSQTMSKYESLFIRNMMIYELELSPETDSLRELLHNGLATMLSFLAFGGLPIYV
jgi:hypothetical protein